tara:strand:+ start:407 stop:667 length:261 start_codon:yes stop_codon:yes gene_type:complete
MSFPKQIIYNINYQKILIDLTFSKQSVSFIDNFKSLINAGPNKNLVMLGRARAGFYYLRYIVTSKNIDDLIKYLLVLPTHYAANKG